MLERPGDTTTGAIACHAGGMESCALPADQSNTDCTGEYLQLLKWLHHRIRRLSRGHSKVVLAGISYGGVWFEDYIRWRARLGDLSSVHGLVLISNPTSEIWCQHFGSMKGDWTEPTTEVPPPPPPPWRAPRQGLRVGGRACMRIVGRARTRAASN
eukprot:4602559-Prymnesium_polylepis.1